MVSDWWWVCRLDTIKNISGFVINMCVVSFTGFVLNITGKLAKTYGS